MNDRAKPLPRAARNNYALMLEDARRLFLGCDMERGCRRVGQAFTDTEIPVRILGETYILRRADARVNPCPGIERHPLLLLLLVPPGALLASASLAVVVLVLIMELVMVFALRLVRDVAVHVNSAVEVAVRLLHERPSKHLARIPERDGQRAFPAHDLRHRVVPAEAAHRGRNGQNGESRRGKGQGPVPHSRLLRRASEARPSRTAI